MNANTRKSDVLPGYVDQDGGVFYVFDDSARETDPSVYTYPLPVLDSDFAGAVKARSWFLSRAGVRGRPLHFGDGLSFVGRAR